MTARKKTTVVGQQSDPLPKTTKKAAKSKDPTAAKPYSAQDPGERKFLVDTYDQTRALLDRVPDKERRKGFETRLKDIRAKFNALPKSKVTKERVERYVGEITKIGREILGP